MVTQNNQELHQQNRPLFGRVCSNFQSTQQRGALQQSFRVPHFPSRMNTTRRLICAVLLGCLIQSRQCFDEEYDGLLTDTRAELAPVDLSFNPWEAVNKRAIELVGRSLKLCGNGRACPPNAVCCGPVRCCKKGWSCRYKPSMRRFDCIP